MDTLKNSTTKWGKYDKKYEVKTIKFTPEEWNKIKIASSAIGIAPATFIKSCALGYRSKLIPRPSKSDMETVKQLRKMGNNLNQIAKTCNQTKEVDACVLSYIKSLKDLFINLEEKLE